MPANKCDNGKFRWGEGECIYDTAEEAQEANETEMYSKTVNVVMGAPCSGKTTYVFERANPNDLIAIRESLAKIPKIKEILVDKHVHSLHNFRHQNYHQ